MRTHVLQDWITVRGSSTVTSIVQNEQSYLDAAPYQDVMVYVDIRSFTGTLPTLSIETAPIKDGSLFTAMLSEFSPSSTLVVWKITLSANPAVPVARWVRWRLSATAGAVWDMTFRVVVAGNSLCM
jgi:hypothetical protein